MPIVRPRLLSKPLVIRHTRHAPHARRTRRVGAAAALSLVFALALGLVSTQAASTSFWLVSTQTDFLKGEVEQLTVDTDGRVMLGPAIETISQTSTPAVWRIALDTNGNVWAGTGNEGKVLKVDRSGKTTTVFDATELEVHALAAGPNGTMFVGSSPDGRIYKITPDGKTAPFFDPDDKYIWSLLVAPDGTLYAGTGEKGRIYKISPDGKGALFFETGTTHVTTLAWDATKGALLVGTSSPGRVLRVDATGKGFVLLESSYKEVRAIRQSSAGTMYVTAVGAGGTATSEPSEKPSPTESTSAPIATVSTEVTVTAIGDTAIVTPSTSSQGQTRSSSGTAKGAIYRIAPDGDWSEVWTSTDDAPYDVVIEPNGSLLVATGDKGKLYRISGDPAMATLVTRATAQQITGFAQDSAGHVYCATSNPGRILRFTASQADRGTYTSDVKDTTTVSTWGAIRWRGVAPAGTTITVHTRSGNTKTPDQTWSEWSKAYTNASGEPIASPKARYLQWKAVLAGSASATPVLTSVTAAYLPRNSRPTIESITVHPPGVVFQRPYPTGEPEVAGFDTGTSDGRPPTQAASSSSSAVSSLSAPALGRKMFQKSLQTFVWRAEDPDEDRLQYDVWYRREGETDWKVLKRGIWDSLYTWDTTAVPDGTYVVKVVASDAPGNAPNGALTAERESAPFEIDNTPPMIDVAIPGQTPGKALFIVRDSHSPIQRVEYSTNAGGWKLLYPVDGLLDSREERFEMPRDPASTSPIVLRASDTMGNVATAVLPAPASTSAAPATKPAAKASAKP
jgi:sugar lactone lactonase YvrE